ncbi:MAG TPA: SMC-Scp complex subunit ScpB [Terracidiphilus sp.]|nr:SMC-Scp complex subunit ScpB [Terracidiphilus sp.]
MSLRAKLEAVIYAAEEPVTLAQLAGLFAEEALEYKAKQEAAAQEAKAAGQPEALPMLDAGLAYLGLEQTPEFYAAPETAGPAPQANEPDAAPAEPAVLAGEAQESADAADPEAEAKALLRQRDRDVKAILRQQLDELIASYEADERGVEIREIAGGYRMATKPEYHDSVRLFIRSLKQPLKLSLPALETLAVIAYKQPVTAPEVNEIRGVESSGVFGSLLSRKLITTAGRKQVIGRPILYKTTKEFLLRFGLKDVSELPSMEEFEKMAAVELSETEEGEGAVPGQELVPELDENAAEEETMEGSQPAVSAVEPPDLGTAPQNPSDGESAASNEVVEVEPAHHE